MAHWEVVIEGRQGTNDMLTVLHYESTGTEPPDWTGFAFDLAGEITTHLAPICAPRVTWVGITVREDIPGGVGLFVPFPGGTVVGLDASGDQADLLTMLVRKLTGSLVKPTRGWALQGGITAHGLTADGVWEIAIREDVNAFYEAIRVVTLTGPTTMSMVVKARNVLAPNTQPYTLVTSFNTGSIPGALQSRKIGSGS